MLFCFYYCVQKLYVATAIIFPNLLFEQFKLNFWTDVRRCQLAAACIKLTYLFTSSFVYNRDSASMVLPLCVNKNMNRGKFCLFVVILCLHRQFCTSQVYLPSIISAIDSSLQYYANNYMRMNLDGIFGLRVLEGSYHVLKVAHKTCLERSDHFLNRIFNT